MNQRQFDGLQEAAKCLHDPDWVKEFAHGDDWQAAVILSEKHGFAGRPDYMRMLCLQVPNHQTLEEMSAYADRIEEEGVREIIAYLQPYEVSVPPEYQSGADPSAMFPGGCYKQGWYYTVMPGHGDVLLIHGTIMMPNGRRTTHAWVEIPGDVVFDGVTQRFYDKNGYYSARDAKVDNEYGQMDAVVMSIENEGQMGPWPELPPDDEAVEENE